MQVSVVIPVFNRARTIVRAIESVFAQTRAPFELIVVDDGSSDGTAEIVDRRFGPTVKLIRQRNAGPSAARNTGIRAAQGQIIAFLDSDDTWMPEKLARQVSLLTAHSQAVCCICNTEMVYPAGRRNTSFAIACLRPDRSEGVWINPTEVLLTRFLLFNQTVAVRRTALDRVGLFREDYRIMEDYDLALRLSTIGPWAFLADPQVQWFGDSENSLTKSASGREIVTRSYQILCDLRDSLPPARPCTKLLKKRLWLLQIRIMAHAFANRPNSPRSVVGHGMLAALRAHDAIYRRLPSFPKMITAMSGTGVA